MRTIAVCHRRRDCRLALRKGRRCTDECTVVVCGDPLVDGPGSSMASNTVKLVGVAMPGQLCTCDCSNLVPAGGAVGRAGPKDGRLSPLCRPRAAPNSGTGCQDWLAPLPRRPPHRWPPIANRYHPPHCCPHGGSCSGACTASRQRTRPGWGQRTHAHALSLHRSIAGCGWPPLGRHRHGCERSAALNRAPRRWAPALRAGPFHRHTSALGAVPWCPPALRARPDRRHAPAFSRWAGVASRRPPPQMGTHLRPTVV